MFDSVLDSKSLAWTFGVCLSLTIVMPAICPSIRLLFFSPFLITALYQKPIPTALCLALLCGFILDLLSSSPRLGIHALDFCVTLAILYKQQRNFFADSLSTLPFMTFLFSMISTAIFGLLVYTIEMQNIISLRWIFTDLLLMPVADAGYAFVVFILPALFFGKRRLSGKDYFLEKSNE